MAVESPRFFVDENSLALGRCLAAARRDVVHPSHPRLPQLPYGTKDEDWLTVIGQRRGPRIRPHQIFSAPIRKRRLGLSLWGYCDL